MTMLSLESMLGALHTAGLKANSSGETITASLGPALRRRSATFGFDDAVSACGAGTPSEIASVARGIYATLNSPLLKAHEEPISFRDAAAVISVSLEGPRFAAGVALAGGRPAYLVPFIDGLQQAFLIERDLGYHLLTEHDVARWDMHPERIAKAAASILYHRTGYWREPETEEIGGQTVVVYKIGDGFDAGRATILEELDFHRWREGFFFAVPDSDRLWIADREADPRALATAVEAAYASADAPLSTHLYQVEDRQISRAHA